MDYTTIASAIYFFAGNTLSVIATIELLLLIIRKLFKLENQLTVDRVDLINKFILLVGIVTGVAFLIELFSAWRSGILYEQLAFYSRVLGKHWWAYAMLFAGNLLFPQLYWFKSLRRNLYVTFVIALLINFGVAWERFIIIVTSLADDYLPTSWSYFPITWTDIRIAAVLIGAFVLLLVSFYRKWRSGKI